MKNLDGSRNVRVAPYEHNEAHQHEGKTGAQSGPVPPIVRGTLGLQADPLRKNGLTRILQHWKRGRPLLPP